jgi:uncharacterized membrane protein
MVPTALARTAFGLLFVLAGTFHFLFPAYYRAVVPPYLPIPDVLVAVSGVAEIAGGVGLLLPRWRPAAGVGLVLLLVAVLPANVEMLRQARHRGVAAPLEALLWLRLPFQAVLMWLTWRVSRPPRGERTA